jgi:hypothetical protein
VLTSKPDVGQRFGAAVELLFDAELPEYFVSIAAAGSPRIRIALIDHDERVPVLDQLMVAVRREALPDLVSEPRVPLREIDLDNTIPANQRSSQPIRP